MSRRRRLDSYSGELPRDKAARLIRANVDRREAAYRAMTTAEGWEAFLTARCLHRYSWRNCALIASQRPDALAVATFSQWKAAGYPVREGEHSTVAITTRQGGRFSSASLFDVTQTDMPIHDPGDVLPDDFEYVRERLSDAVPRPTTTDDVTRAGEGVQLAYERLTRAQEGVAA